jgi:hypothetical protein
MRKSGLRLNVFAPVADLSAISKSESGQAPNAAGGRVLGDEWTEHVVKVRWLDAAWSLSLMKCNVTPRTEVGSFYEKGMHLWCYTFN